MMLRKVCALSERLEPRCLLSFSAPVSYNIGSQPDGFVPNAAPIDVVTGDFNGDGKLDLVVAHRVDGSVYFLPGKGDGTFQPAVQIAVGEAIEGRVFAGDFNNDGKLDLFLPGDLTAANHPIVLLGNGNGTFKTRIDSSSFAYASTYPRGWSVGDFNGDGKLDIFTTLPGTSADGGAYMCLLGNGDGTFQAGIVGAAVLHYSRWSVAGDFNGDGKLDVAIADGQGAGDAVGTAELTILLGNGDGTFRLGGHYASPQTPNGQNIVVNPEDVVVADLNHDGKLDAIVSDYDHNINVFIGNGDGTFQKAMGIDGLEYPRDVTVVDVNGDGIPDLVTDNVGVGPGGSAFAQEGSVPGTVAVLIGNGDGTFQAPIQYNGVYYPGWTAVGDFNGDTLPDLATTQVSNGHSVNVELNKGSTGSPSLVTPAYATVDPVLVNTVAGSTTGLSVLGADAAGESGLIYTWSVVSVPAGASDPTFSVNQSNFAKNTTAAFAQAGLYGFAVTITDPGGASTSSIVQVQVTVNQAPTVATAAKASPSPVSGNSTALSVFGADDGGEFNLTYTWATTGTPPAPVTFSVNGTHDSQNTTATFYKAGAYSFVVTITDQNGLSMTSAVNVTVSGIFTSIASVSAGPSPVMWPRLLNLTAMGVSARAGSVAGVSFYRESNGVPGLQTGAGGDGLVGNGTAGTNGTWIYTADVSGWQAGHSVIYALAVDSQGNSSPTGVAAASVTAAILPVGDANGDYKVDGSDYSLIDNGYLQQLTGWMNGDFNNDGVVNGSDYTLIDNSFNTQGTVASVSAANAARAAAARLVLVAATAPVQWSIIEPEVSSVTWAFPLDRLSALWSSSRPFSSGDFWLSDL